MRWGRGWRFTQGCVQYTDLLGRLESYAPASHACSAYGCGRGCACLCDLDGCFFGGLGGERKPPPCKTICFLRHPFMAEIVPYEPSRFRVMAGTRIRRCSTANPRRSPAAVRCRLSWHSRRLGTLLRKLPGCTTFFSSQTLDPGPLGEAKRRDHVSMD